MPLPDSQTPAQFWHYLELVSDPTGLGSVSGDGPHFRSQLVTSISDPLAINSEGPHSLSLDLIINDDNSQNSGKCFTYQFILKDTTQEQPDEEMCKARYVGDGRGASMPPWVLSLPVPPCVYPLEALCLGFLMESWLWRHNWLRHGGWEWGWRFQPSHHALVSPETGYLGAQPPIIS